MKKKVLFILGSGRSGSTLLTLILGSHPSCFAIGELDKLYGKYIKKQSICGICQDNCSFWNEKFDEREFKKFALFLGNNRINSYVPLQLDKFLRTVIKKDNFFNPYSYLFFTKLGSNKQIIIDSSKEIEWVSQRLDAREFKQEILDGYFVHIIRDGRAVVNSILRIKPRMTVIQASQQWLTTLSKIDTFFDLIPAKRKITVCYEKLVTKPEENIKNICDMLDIEFNSQMIRYWHYDHHLVAGNSGTRSLIWRARNKSITYQGQDFSQDYYKNLDFGLKLDLRWQKELSKDQLEEFNRIAGEINKAYEWNE
jgi:hypothetical protein